MNLDHITFQGIMTTLFTRTHLWAIQACSDSFRSDGARFTFSPRDQGEEPAQPFRELRGYASLAAAVAFARDWSVKSLAGELYEVSLQRGHSSVQDTLYPHPLHR